MIQVWSVTSIVKQGVRTISFMGGMAWPIPACYTFRAGLFVCLHEHLFEGASHISIQQTNQKADQVVTTLVGNRNVGCVCARVRYDLPNSLVIALNSFQIPGQILLDPPSPTSFQKYCSPSALGFYKREYFCAIHIVARILSIVT